MRKASRWRLLATLGIAAAFALSLTPAASAGPTQDSCVLSLSTGKRACFSTTAAALKQVESSNETRAGALYTLRVRRCQRTIGQTYSESTTDSFGIEITARTKLGESFEAEIKTTFNHLWTWSFEKSDQIEVTIDPHMKVDIRISPNWVEVNGTWEVRYKSDIHYVHGFQAWGPMSFPSWHQEIDVTGSC